VLEGSQKMSCPQRTNDGAGLIVAYAARTLDSKGQAAFEEHLESCAICRETAAAQRAVWSALDELLPLPVSSNFDAKLYRRIAEEQHRAWWRRWPRAEWRWRPGMPVAAACAVLIVAFLLKTSGQFTEPSPPAQTRLQIEQVESALDDMDLLKQAGVEFVLEKNTPRKQI
jgi:anti-sigma factor RsiW